MKTFFLFSLVLGSTVFGSDCSLLHPIPAFALLNCGKPVTLRNVLVSETPSFLHPEHFLAGTDSITLDLFNIKANSAPTDFVGGLLRIEGKQDSIGFTKNYPSSDGLAENIRNPFGTTFYETTFADKSTVTRLTFSVRDEEILSILLESPIYLWESDHAVFTGRYQQLCVLDGDLLAD